ncbi:MAG: VWA domain-containing protein [Candidatus Sumerlaeia bacterium]
MTFASEQILVLCVAAVPLLLVFFVWASGRRRRLMARFADERMQAYLLRRHDPGAWRWKAAMNSAALILALLALSRPQWGVVERPLLHRGVDVLILIDVSTSMKAADIKPDRMTRARELLASLVRRMKGHRVGVAAFAGDAVRVCPLTLDYEMAMTLINTVDTDLIPVQGTAIARAIDKSLSFFDKSSPTHKVLVLITDGEDQEGRPVEAARRAAEAGVVIHAIGIGSPDGAPVYQAGGAIKKDREGKGVVSRLDFQTLQQVALATGGKAIVANPSGDLEVQEILLSLDAMEKGEFETRRYTAHEERFQWFLLPAVLLLILEPLKSERRRQGRRADATRRLVRKAGEAA